MMNNNNDIVGTTKGTSTLTRARFGPGMLLQHGDLEQLNNYTRDLSRLLFQSFFGCGVVCGLTVEGTEECGRLKVTVQPGVALTCAGDPVYVPAPVEPIWTVESFKPENATEVWIKLCRKTKCCAPRVTTCSSDDDEANSDCTREREGYEIHLQTTKPDCACACPDPRPITDPTWNPQNIPNPREQREPMYPACHTDHYKGVCGCTCGECSQCDCDCILLARLYRTTNPKKLWLPDHGVRRFIRPAMITVDPATIEDAKARKELEQYKTDEWPGTANEVETLAAENLRLAKELKKTSDAKTRVETRLQKATEDKKKLEAQAKAKAGDKTP